MDSEDAITRIKSADSELRRAQYNLDQAVFDAKAEGHSWAVIAEAFGTSRQAAYERFAPYLAQESRVVSLFMDDDAGYLTWIRTNPGGSVVNCSREPGAAYLKLHRATCHTISGEPARGSTWTKDYIKVCAPVVVELAKWAKAKTGGQLQPCGTCHPSV